MAVISPTGKPARENDGWGSGAWGASRGKGKRHKGTDYVCEPGQAVRAPISGVVVREARPYADEPFSGLLMRNEYVELVLFYVDIDRDLIGEKVVKGQELGKAQNIADMYPDMIPHIHMEIRSIDPDLFVRIL